MRVLILEDDGGVRQFLEDALTKGGHEPTAFGHAGLALGAIARGQFELLLCDLMLPNINGLDAIKMARSQWPYLPIIVISALDENDWQPRAFEAGASCYMQKPIRVDRLLTELKLVERSQVQLAVGVIDNDIGHRERVVHDLSSMGCTVSTFRSLAAVTSRGSAEGGISVLLVDASHADVADALRWAASRDVAGVAFGPDSPDFDEDKLMRWGACFCLLKPIDTQALVTQARFFVAPTTRGIGF